MKMRARSSARIDSQSFVESDHLHGAMGWAERFLETLPERRYAILRLLRCFPGDPERVIEEIRAGEADAYEVVRHVVERLKAEGLAPKTVYGFYLFLLKRFFLFCDIELSAAKLRIRLGNRMARSVRCDRAPTREEVRRLIYSANSPQLRLLIHLLASTGLRVSEALSLRWSDLRLDEDPPRLEVISAKSGERREVFLTKELAEELKRYPRKGERVFGYTRKGAINAFSYLLDRLKMRRKVGRGYDLHLHSLRKFYKTRLEEAGINPLFIELWMGHVSGVVHAYFKPSKRMEIEEWRRAERALTLLASEEDSQLYEDRRIEELEREIEAIKRILTDVLDRLESSHSRRAA